MKWQLSIEKIANGFIVSYDEDYGDEEGENIVHKQFAFENKNDDDDNAKRESLLRALEMMISYFDLSYNKHYRPNDKFIKISLVSGNSYFDDDEITHGHNNTPLGNHFIYPVLSAEEAAKQKQLIDKENNKGD